MSVENHLRDGWKKYCFNQMAFNINEHVLPADAEGLPYVGLEHLDTDSLKIRRWGTPDEVEAQKLRFYSGDIIFGKRRFYQRKLAVAEFQGICSAHAMVLQAKPEVVDPMFLPFFMQSETFYERAMAISVGSLSPTINWSMLAKQEFSLPPLEEQHRIADILWAVEEAIDEYLLAKAAISIAQKVFSKDQFVRLPHGGKTFREIGEWLSGGTPSRARPDYWDGNIPWVSPKDMKVDRLLDSEEHISREGLRVGSRILPENTILFVTRGMILAHTFPIAITGTQMAFNQDLKAVIPYKEFDPYFVFYWLQYNASQFLNLVTETSHGTKRLATNMLESTAFPDLSFDGQREIAQKLGVFDQQTQTLNEQVSVLRKLKSDLIHKLLDEAFPNV